MYLHVEWQSTEGIVKVTVCNGQDMDANTVGKKGLEACSSHDEDKVKAAQRPLS